MQTNRLYFGDCLEVMQEYLPDASVDLIYLDPPFNSKRIYNAFIGGAQWVAFSDTWRWHEAVDDFHAVAGDVALGKTMEGLRTMLGTGPELAYLSYMANRLRECQRVLKPAGSIYLHCDPTMSYKLRLIMDAIFEPKRFRFRNEIIWSYRRWPSQSTHFQTMHDVLLFYAGPANTFNTSYEKVSDSYQKRFKGKTQVLDPVRKTRKLVVDEPTKGLPQRAVWDISILAGSSKERMGYPTQKPLALLDRVIKASSNENDTILDPFCGCGTTIHAAQNLGRRWIGIDICVNACKVIQRRIESHFDSLWDDIEFVGMPKTLDDARTLAEYDPFKFERWAASLTPGMEANKRQRGDGGIDGWCRLPIRKGVFVDVVSQVKGGDTQPRDVRAFDAARQQAHADMGVFTCFDDKVTAGMRNVAANAGRFQKWPVLQIYTVEDYFAERTPDLPLAA